MDTPQVLLDHHLKALHLPTFLREYDKAQFTSEWHTSTGRNRCPCRCASFTKVAG